MLNGTSLVEVILYGHLLLEQALDLRIQAGFKRPDVLTNSRLARLTFAQKMTVYVGLHDPNDDQVSLLLGFNRLRNRLAHTFANLEDAVLECLPDESAPPVPNGSISDIALDRVQSVFLWLAFFELKAIEGVRRLDRIDRPVEATWECTWSDITGA
ncbi:hypothetical protein [Nonomuraea sp. NPDC049028]|uniref:hypothetical protein n=1 Tax=Nonomuraea sp. NPDC049028 TaxID=3364348 RepID=UPI00371F13A7